MYALTLLTYLTFTWPLLVNADGIRLVNSHENVLIQPWGPDGFRVRATQNGQNPTSGLNNIPNILNQLMYCRG
jgi:hypothetical protein